MISQHTYFLVNELNFFGFLEKFLFNDAYYLYKFIITEENKEGGDDANMMQMNGDIQGNGATNQEDAEMEEGKKMKYLLQFAWDNASLLSRYNIYICN